MIKKIAFVAYAVADIKKARAFYEGVLGLRPNSEFDGSNDAQWVEYDIGGDTLGIGCSKDWPPSPDGASVALEVDDFEDFLEMLKAKKVPIKMGPHDFPTCKMVVILDPDKNKVTIHQKKKQVL